MIKLCFRPVIGSFELLILFPNGATEYIDFGGLTLAELRAEVPRLIERFAETHVESWALPGDGISFLIEDLDLRPGVVTPINPTTEDFDDLDTLAVWATTRSDIATRVWRPKWHWKQRRDQPSAPAIDPRTYAGEDAPLAFYHSQGVDD